MNPQDQRITIGINELFQFHAYLKGVAEPSPAIIACLTITETHITTFFNSLQSGAVPNVLSS